MIPVTLSFIMALVLAIWTYVRFHKAKVEQDRFVEELMKDYDLLEEELVKLKEYMNK